MCDYVRECAIRHQRNQRMHPSTSRCLLAISRKEFSVWRPFEEFGDLSAFDE